MVEELKDINVRAVLWPIVLNFKQLKLGVIQVNSDKENKLFSSAEDLYLFYQQQVTPKISK